jgi:predicted nucleic acid-binding protein
LGVVVFDSDVLIGFLNRDDARHDDAVEAVRESLTATRRLVCSVNYAEILVGPLRAGNVDVVDQLLVRLNIETIQVDMALAQRAAEVRARTNLKLPDAFALATALHAKQRWQTEVALASFDRAVLKAKAELDTD